LHSRGGAARCRERAVVNLALSFRGAKARKRELDTHLINVSIRFAGPRGRYQPDALVAGGVLIANHAHVEEPGAPRPWAVETGLAARFGRGIDVYLNRHFVIYLGGTYEVATTDVKSQKYGTPGIGFQYRF
jgi:hypothetical protein